MQINIDIIQAQNQAQVAQNEAYRQRLNQLEDENEERRHAVLFVLTIPLNFYF